MRFESEISNILKTKYPQAFEGSTVESQYFFFDAEQDSKSDLAIVFGGYEKCAPDFEIERNTYPYYVIECPTNGKCSLAIGSVKHQLKRGILAGFGPGVSHHYLCDKNDPMEHIFIAFTGSGAAELMEAGTLAAKGAFESADPEETIRLMEAVLRNGLKKTQYSQQLACGYLRLLLLEQASSAALSGHDCAISEATYRRCRRFMDENFSSISFPSQVASACEIDVRYMSHLFKTYGRISPHQYLMRLKMNKAVILLLTSNLSINRIANTVGFEDPYHFSRNFRKVHGISPRQYREIHTS